MMQVWAEDDIINGFNQLRYLHREVGMEQLSKAGAVVQKSIRDEMSTSGGTKLKTSVNSQGVAYLERASHRKLGARESHSDGKDSHPANMSSFIQSALFEKSDTLVVAGANPRMHALKRRDGRVVGSAGIVHAVGTRNLAILNRLDTGQESASYPAETKLKQSIKGRFFISKGINSSMSRVNSLLKTGFFEAYRRAKIDEIKIRRRVS